MRVICLIICRSVEELSSEVLGRKAALEEAERVQDEEEEEEAKEVSSHTLAWASEGESDVDGELRKEVQGLRLPSQLIKAKAYLLWVDAGRPEGADFDPAAYEVLAEAVQAGR
jgi:hypothetical protein